MHLLAVLQAIALLAAANGAPVVAKKILGRRFAAPLDGGALFIDGRPIFGASKTIRGIIVALAAATAVAPLVGVAPATGALAGAGAMLGDLCSSFVKRRLGRAPSSRALGLDQVPEALLPLLACRGALALSAADIALAVAAFFVGEILLSRLLYRIRLRDEPY